MDHWVNVMGVGPGTISTGSRPIGSATAADSAMEMSVALAHSGDLQIELINSAMMRLMYKEFSIPAARACSTCRTGPETIRRLYDRASRSVTGSGMKADRWRTGPLCLFRHAGPSRYRDGNLGHQRKQGEFFEHIRRVAAGGTGLIRSAKSANAEGARSAAKQVTS